MLESLTLKQKIIFFIILLIMIIVIIYYFYSTIYSNQYYLNNNIDLLSDEFVEKQDEYNSINSSEKINSIVVYVCGAVKESKVISLEENSRVGDAIDAVGGLSKDADLTNINLASILEDGQKIYIPKIGEDLQTDSTQSTEISYNNTLKNNSKININKATQTELETIPGVGPSTALKIINYRNENGKFSSIEEIKNVSGIGDAKYEQIKNYICIK